jgi:Flp pilus assembly protein TadD
MRQGDLSAAIGCFNDAQEIWRGHPGLHHNLGTAFKETGDLPSAIYSHNTALALRPNWIVAIESLSNYLMASLNGTPVSLSWHQR